MKNSTYTWSIRFLSLVVVLAAWELYGRSVNPILFTYPTAVARAFVELVSKGELQRFLAQSLEVFLYGFALAAVVGIPLGILLARSASSSFGSAFEFLPRWLLSSCSWSFPSCSIPSKE